MPARLVVSGGQEILVVAPHPDDEVAGCAGAILEHRRGGDRVRVVCVTDGRKSRALGLAPEAMARTRRREAEAAAVRLDVELEWMGLPEGDWHLKTLASQLREILARARPRVIYAPSRVDFHPEHVRVARALAQALSGSLEAGEIEAPEVRIYAVQVPLTPILANLIVAIGTSASGFETGFEKRIPAEIRSSLRAHRSQIGTLERCLRHRRNVGRLYGLRAAEEFWRLSARQYSHLHREPAECEDAAQPRADVFRGLRYYAWSDPLATLFGLSERRRLAELVSGFQDEDAT